MKDYGMRRFADKTVFITGGAGFIGQTLAYRFAAEGANVAIADINKETLDRAAEKCEGRILPIVCDVTDSASVDAAVAKADETFGRFDVLVHCAGGSARGDGKLLVDQSDEVINRVIGVNLMGAFWSNRAAARAMIRHGNGGRIINIASAVGIGGLCGCVDYAASKGGIMSMTKSLMKELAPHGITVNTAAFGVVARPESQDNPAYTNGTNYLGQMCTAEDCAALVCFLASYEARFITGANYVLDGGRTYAMKGTDGAITPVCTTEFDNTKPF